MPTPSHRRARRRGMLLGAAISSSRSKKAAMNSHAPAVESTSAQGETTKLLKELKDLLDAGILTQSEFDKKKKQVLGI